MSDDEVRRSLEARAADAEPSEELRGRIERREPIRERGPSTARRVAIAVFALAISAAAFALIIPRGDDPPATASPTAPDSQHPPSPSSGAKDFETFELDPGIGRLTAAFGSIWVVGPEGVTRVDPDSGEIVAEIPIQGITPPGTELPLHQYGGVANGSAITSGDGVVWVTAEPDIVALDPETNEIVQRISVETSLTNIAFHDGQLVLGGMAEGSGHLLLVPQDPDPQTWTGLSSGTDAFPLVLATDHWYWMGSATTRLGPALTRWSSDLAELQSIEGIGSVEAFAEAAGSVWVVGDGNLYRVDAGAGGPRSGKAFPEPVDAVTATIPLEGMATIGGDGDRLWLLVEAGAVCELRELDPRTGDPIGEPVEIHLPFPAEMTVAEGVPWVSYRANPVLRRGVLIRPAAAG